MMVGHVTARVKRCDVTAVHRRGNRLVGPPSSNCSDVGWVFGERCDITTEPAQTSVDSLHHSSSVTSSVTTRFIGCFFLCFSTSSLQRRPAFSCRWEIGPTVHLLCYDFYFYFCIIFFTSAARQPFCVGWNQPITFEEVYDVETSTCMLPQSAAWKLTWN